MASHIAVMTLWTKPTRWRAAGAEELWSLSVSRLRRLVDRGYFSGLVLVTDVAGWRWAAALELPFTAIRADLDTATEIEGLEKAWSAGKIWSYANVGEPFVHFDGDTLLSRPLPAYAMAADFLCQTAEKWCPCGERAVSRWYLPSLWMAAADRCAGLSWNFGIFGGLAWREIREAAEEALLVLGRNREALSETDGTWATVLVEQWGMARHLDPWRMATLLPQGRIANEAAGPFFRHLCSTMKNDPAWRRKVSQSLSDEWPEQNARCRDVAQAFP